MQRKFITNLALLLFLNLLVKPFWIFGIDRSVQNLVGAEEYGFYFSLLNFSFLFNILLDFGITNFNNRNIARHHQLLQKHFSGILSLRIILAVVYLIITLSVGLAAGYDGRQMLFLLVLAGNQFLASLILYLRSNISGLLMFRTDSLISVLDRGLMILICGLLLWTNLGGGEFHISWFVLAQTAAYLFTALVALLIVIRKSGFRRMQWNPVFSRMILKQSFPFAVLFLLMSFYNRIDSVLLERLIPGIEGARASGIYALAFRLLDAASQIAFLFAVLLLPLFSRMLRRKEPVNEILRLSITLLFTSGIALAASTSFFSYELMDLFYHEHVAESARVFQILIWCFVPIATTYVFGTLLTANGNLLQLNVMAAVGMLLNLALNFILIPLFQALGAATASLITQGITAGIQLWIAVRILRIRADYAYLLRLFLYAGLTVLIAWGMRFSGLPWGYAMGLAMLSGVVLAFGLGLIRPRALWLIVRAGREVREEV